MNITQEFQTRPSDESWMESTPEARRTVSIESHLYLKLILIHIILHVISLWLIYCDVITMILRNKIVKM